MGQSNRFLLLGAMLGCLASAGQSGFGSASRTGLRPELRGDIFMARKMYLQAIDAFQQAPDSAAVANKIGIAYQELSAFNAAEKSYRHALQLDRSFCDAINNLGTVAYARKRYRGALHQYKQALECEGGHSAPMGANLAAAYLARKDYRKASYWIEWAVLRDPDVFTAHANFGTLMQQNAESERAAFHLYLARAFAKAGDKKAAILYLRKALEEGVKDRAKIPSDPEFAALKNDQEFQQLLVEDPKPL